MPFDHSKLIDLGARLVIIAGLCLAYFVPPFIAQTLGLSDQLYDAIMWAQEQPWWLFGAAFLAYLLCGFFAVIVAGGVALAFAGGLLTGLQVATAWLFFASMDGVQALARFTCDLLVTVIHIALWPFLSLAEIAWDGLYGLGSAITLWCEERTTLRRLYREEYAGEFRSFRRFKRAWRAIQRGEAIAPDPAAPDAEDIRRAIPPGGLEAAIDLLGLGEGFAKRDLEERYRTLMKGVHPDVAGPNGIAQQINAARILIKQRKGWK